MLVFGALGSWLVAEEAGRLGSVKLGAHAIKGRLKSLLTSLSWTGELMEPGKRLKEKHCDICC
eukprot:m.307625 g.307625  ORF g.307625 m.307625 type:complete len:63 (+) comp42546_c0_seq1:1081-1269(+)